jgi:prevent-host-death family protein
MYTVHQAKSNLSKILKQVEQGKEVIIARGENPIARIVPFAVKGKRKAGSLKGQLSWGAGAFEPLTSDELKDWGIE